MLLAARGPTHGPDLPITVVITERPQDLPRPRGSKPLGWCRPGKEYGRDRADLRAGLQPRTRATEAHQSARRGARGHDRDPQGRRWFTRRVSFPLPLARHLQRVGRSWQCKRSAPVEGAHIPQSPESTLVTAPGVPRRSARRATARRASKRRATARQLKDDIERRLWEYLKDHPQSTTGDMAKGLNAKRGTIAAGVRTWFRASEVIKASKGYAAK